MLGAIAGDVAGSRFEARPCQTNWDEFELFATASRFTDDTVMTCAVADALMQGAKGEKAVKSAMAASMQHWGHCYPKAGYGGRFARWLSLRETEAYNSFGNGSAMRVSPVGWVFNSLEEVERQARFSAEVTHNHPEGVKGACSVAGSIFLARTGASKNDIRAYVAGKYGYDLDRSLADIRQSYTFDVTCQGSVPEAIIAFLESENFEEAIRKAIWLRGDADTQAAIAGGIAEAFYGGVPFEIAEKALAKLDDGLRERYFKWQEWLGQ